MNFKEEYLKCYNDKTRIYFIENYLHTFNGMEMKETPFKLFPRQKVYLHSCAENSDTMTLKCRQSGISTVTAAFICGEMVFAKKTSPEIALCLANKKEQAEELVNKIVGFLDQVPRWMWGGDYYSHDTSSPKNTKSIYVKRNKSYVELQNGSKIYARASGPDAARGISSVRLLCIDEAAFIEKIEGYPAARACQSAVADPKCFMISTPKGKDQLYYNTYIQAVQGKNNFNVVEFKWYQDPRYNHHLKWYRTNKENGETEWLVETVIDNRGSVEYDEKRWKNLEKEGWTPTSPWLENAMRQFNNDSQKIAQELLTSFVGSSDNVVPVEVIEQQRKTNVIKITDDWKLKDLVVRETWIWKDPNPSHRYVIAVDPSSGSGDDATSIQVIDVDSKDENNVPFFEQVLEYSGKINGEEIAELVDRYGRIYNNALAVVEAIGGYGDSVVLKLKNFFNYPNLYYDETSVLKNYTTDYAKRLFKTKDNEKLPGFRSNGLRIQMISNFVEMLKNNTFRIRSERVIAELDTWIFKNGRPDHQPGAHDDNLTCLSMGLFVAVYYMLKTDKIKQKDTSIVKSWYINHNNTNTNHKTNGELVVNHEKMSKTINPFTYFQKQTDSTLDACVMLGGFKPKK